MEKSKSLLDDEKFKKKLAKLSPYSRMTVEQRIKEGEKDRRKRQREEERLMRMPKEERLKKIYKECIYVAYDFGRSTGVLVGKGELRPTPTEFEKSRRISLVSGLTWQLKEAGVLPLEK